MNRCPPVDVEDGTRMVPGVEAEPQPETTGVGRYGCSRRWGDFSI